uniref:G-protein coupled receptors family 1 profile domain-containing protein n=1 Tax=Romanomermis culicivorax TaxID=13658 RepID=A0A915L086_ROMCU
MYDLFENDNKSRTCDFHKHSWLEAKFFATSIFGSFVTFLGIVGNLFTIYVMCKWRIKSVNHGFLITLAVFDTCLLLTAFMLYSIEYIAEYTDNWKLYALWISYVPTVYPLSHIAQTCSTYVTVIVTVERYVAVLHPIKYRSMPKKIRAAVLSVVFVTFFSVLYNFPKFFEVETKISDHCSEFGKYTLVPTLQDNEFYSTVYSLWLTQAVMVFVPFFVLLVSNSVITFTFWRNLHNSHVNEALVLDQASKYRKWTVKTRQKFLRGRFRETTTVTIVIVILFLVCNSWGLVTSLMEKIYGVRTLSENFPALYTFSREVVNVLTIVNSSSNFFIYLIFVRGFAKELPFVGGARFSTNFKPKKTKTDAGILVERRKSSKLYVCKSCRKLIALPNKLLHIEYDPKNRDLEIYDMSYVMQSNSHTLESLIL